MKENRLKGMAINMQNTEIVQYNSRNLTGLDDFSVIKSRELHGDNSVKGEKIRGFFPRLLDEMKNPITKILIVSLFANIGMIFYGGSAVETVGIAVSILISTVVSVISEIGSDKAFAEMNRENADISVRVIRSGKIISLPIDDIAVGDIVILSAGDKIPADGIITEGALTLDQSSLNGESSEIEKKPSNGITKPALTDSSSLFRGTIVTKGYGKMLVEKVGESTLYGLMASELSLANDDSPLKAKLGILAKQISRIGFVMAALVFLLNFIPQLITKGFSVRGLIDCAMLGISLLVVSVPEGLPMMITVVLASNMKTMSKSGVLIRKLVGIETAGSIDILFCDKTGTLTKGKMQVEEYIAPDLSSYKYFRDIPSDVKSVLGCEMILTCDASFSDKNIIGGNATERSIYKYVGKNQFSAFSDIKITSKTPFSSQNRYSSATLSGRYNITVFKGAPEVIIPNCTCCLMPNGQVIKSKPGKKISDIIERITENSGRVIALSYFDGKNYVFSGILNIRDSVRREAESSINELTKAGVNVIMVTGDDKRTAVGIAKECRLISTSTPFDNVITGAELSKLTDSEIAELLGKVKIVARALPFDKSRLVKIAKENGHICAMTGDGVNDAPALHAADVGFAMGSGSECAKQAGDIVILDDNIASIKNAVLFGRTILSSIRKFIVFQLTTNLCAAGLCIIAPFLSITNPVTVTQMLWLNLIMDSLGALAFAAEPTLKMYMKMPPVKRNENIITGDMIKKIACMVISYLGCSVLFLSSPKIRNVFADDASFMCGFFCFFVFGAVAVSFLSRSLRLNILSGIFKNRIFILIMSAVFLFQIFIMNFAGEVFRCVPLTANELKICICLAFSIIPIEVIRRFFACLTVGK